MDELLEILMRNKKLTVEQLIELLPGYSQNPDKLEDLLKPIDTGIHIANAAKSGMCFPYFATMLFQGKAVAFKLEKELSNYDYFGRDVEQCSSMKYLTDDPCFYFEDKPKVAVQESRIEEACYRERILEFSTVNSYDLGCIVNVSPYGLQTENVPLPDPLVCEGNEILVSWLKEIVKKESPFQLEARHYKKFNSFFKVPGLQVYFPIHNFGDTDGRDLCEVEQFQKYFAEKVEPRLEKICG